MLRKTVKELLVSLAVPLPRTKTVEDAINLFILGAREANWSHTTAGRYTDKFKSKIKGRSKHYIWLLDSVNKKYCNTCECVKHIESFYKGRQSICKSCHLEYQRDNSHIYALNTANYNSAKILASPIWADKVKIREMYLNCPEGYHVDHIVPLRGTLVSGLHVETNLQYLTAEENIKKSNKFMLD